jgi:hypothetical protein
MAGQEKDEFFIGYAPPMPPRLARFVTRVVIALTCAVVVWAVVVAAGHVPLDAGAFEFGHPASFSGTIVEHPYPALRLDGVNAGAEPWALLVAPGKHGAEALVRGLDGRHLTLRGTRIERGAHTMIEVEPASLSVVNQHAASSAIGSAEPLRESDEAQIELIGEIVDAKCFLGVMVPGAGKTHKECASLCLRGGIPPALHVQDRNGQSSLLLMTGPRGEPIGTAALRAAGEAISIRGTIARQGNWLMIRTDPAWWHTVSR